MKKFLLALAGLFVLSGSAFAESLLDQATKDDGLYSRQDYKKSPTTNFHSDTAPRKGSNVFGGQNGAAGTAFPNNAQQRTLENGFGDYRNGNRSF